MDDIENEWMYFDGSSIPFSRGWHQVKYAIQHSLLHRHISAKAAHHMQELVKKRVRVIAQMARSKVIPAQSKQST